MKLGNRRANWIEFFDFHLVNTKQLIHTLLNEELSNELRLKLRELEDSLLIYQINAMLRHSPFTNRDLSCVSKIFYEYLIEVSNLKNYAKSNFI